MPSIVRVLLCLALVGAAGCASSLKTDAVAACPYCGDPAMKRLADGSEVVIPRWRLVDVPGLAAVQPSATPATATH